MATYKQRNNRAKKGPVVTGAAAATAPTTTPRMTYDEYKDKMKNATPDQKDRIISEVVYESIEYEGAHDPNVRAFWLDWAEKERIQNQGN